IVKIYEPSKKGNYKPQNAIEILKKHKIVPETVIDNWSNLTSNQLQEEINKLKNDADIYNQKKIGVPPVVENINWSNLDPSTRGHITSLANIYLPKKGRYEKYNIKDALTVIKENIDPELYNKLPTLSTKNLQKT